ncbi:MAG: CPBP family glutamic-type intramembrane protease [Cyanobacteria bacterium P01_F01_bin.150]
MISRIFSLLDRFRFYLKENTFKGCQTKPLSLPLSVLAIVAFYITTAIGFGLSSGLFEVKVIPLELALKFLVTSFIFPSFLEEIVFRGMLIPINTAEKDIRNILVYSLISTAAFVLWHPLNALTINPGGQAYFLDGRFLLIVFSLGITCSLTYSYSKSIWIPVTIHWLTVIVWVCFLGGRNLLL